MILLVSVFYIFDLLFWQRFQRIIPIKSIRKKSYGGGSPIKISENMLYYAQIGFSKPLAYHMISEKDCRVGLLDWGGWTLEGGLDTGGWTWNIDMQWI